MAPLVAASTLGQPHAQSGLDSYTPPTTSAFSSTASSHSRMRARSAAIASALAQRRREPQEIAHQLRPLRRQHALGMELHALDGEAAMAHGHDLAFGGGRAHFEFRGHGRGLRDQRMVAPHFAGIGQPVEQCPAIVLDDRGLPMHQSRRAHHIAAEHHGLGADYYVKTFHPDTYWSATPKEKREEWCWYGPRSLDHDGYHDNIFCLDPERTADFMRSVNKPWFAFKVMAAGALRPEIGFNHAFRHGADFVIAGMFDFQVATDVEVAVKAIKRAKVRERTWCA